MISLLSLSGWGQGGVFPDWPECAAFDYLHHPSLESAFAALSTYRCRTAIGWSLGGQVLLRAVGAGVIWPEKLVLIATPLAFSHPEAEAFYASMEHDAATTLARFRLMIATGDRNMKSVIRALHTTSTSPHLLYWLKELYQFNGEGMDFSGFSPSLILHGRRDTVVPFTQAERLQQLLPEATLVACDEAAHAPHLHDSGNVHRIITDYAA